jgi:NAD kinase
MVDYDKIVMVTKKTWLEELIERFNTKAQAKFYIDHNIGQGTFDYYEESHEIYHESLRILKKIVASGYRHQIIERENLANFLFNPNDLVITIGPDGLVVNTAKYLENQHILAINPDPEHIEGVLLPYNIDEFSKGLLEYIRSEEVKSAKITMAKAELNNGLKMHAVNDLFIGHKSHQSARYTITYGGTSEAHSSSGIIVSTGAGSTGWFKSVITGAMGITKLFWDDNIPYPQEPDYRFPWDSDFLCYSVREPWSSKTSGASIIFGRIHKGDTLTIESKMPENGVIFSDGIEKDFIKFNSGTIATIGVADRKVNLILNA